jgi:hypothetical protein
MAQYSAECPLLSLELTRTHLKASAKSGSAKSGVAVKVPIKDEHTLKVLQKALPAIR